MNSKKNKNKIEEKLDLIVSLLKDLIAIELKKIGRTQKEIQKLVKMDMN